MVTSFEAACPRLIYIVMRQRKTTAVYLVAAGCLRRNCDSMRSEPGHYRQP